MLKQEVYVTDNIMAMTGIGHEWLVDKQGLLIAKFENGMLAKGMPPVTGNSEPTVALE